MTNSENYDYKNNLRNVNDRSLSTTEARDYSLACETSESLSHDSLTDLRLTNLRSKLKAEVEEIRKWKQEANIKERMETNIGTEFSLNFHSQQLNQSKIEQKLSSNDEETSNCCSKYKAIRISQNYKNVNEEEIICSPIDNDSENYMYLNKKSKYLPNERINQASVEINFNSSDKNNFTYSSNSFENFSNKKETFGKQNKISTSNKSKYFPETDIEKQSDDERKNDSTNNAYHNKRSKFLSNFEEDNIEILLEKEIDYLKSIIKNKDEQLKEFNMQISKIVLTKDNILKENVRLKKQEMEMKYQMTNLLTVAAVSKDENIKNKEFSKYEEKITEITKKIKILVNENKHIFQNIKDELLNQNGKCIESNENIKFLEDKLNSKDSQFQNMRGQLELLTANYDELQLSSRNINDNLTYQKDQIKKENLLFTKKLENQRNEISVILERNEVMKSELLSKENIKLELRMIIDKQKLTIKELQQLKVSLEEKVNIIKTKLLLASKEISHKDKTIIELQEFLKLSQSQCQETYCRIEKIEVEQKELLLNKENEMKSIERKHVQEKLNFTKEINSMILEFQEYSKASEKSMQAKNKEIINLESQLTGLKQQKKEMIEYLYKLPTSSIKWNHFFQ